MSEVKRLVDFAPAERAVITALIRAREAAARAAANQETGHRLPATREERNGALTRPAA